MLKRAYSVFDIKGIDDEKRTITGIATTASPDRMNDVVVTDGIEFKMPLPFLYQHNARQPIGHVTAAKVNKDHIAVTIQMAASGIAGFIDEAWALIKAGLVRGLSIGFRSLEESWNKETGGYNFLRSEWMELSAVTIPANSEANILTVKAFGADEAVSGRKFDRVVRLSLNPNLPGVPGQTRGTPPMKKTIKEQIEQFESKRAADAARMTAIMEKSGEEGRTLLAEEVTEYDGLEADVKSTDAHLVRLKAMEQQNIEKAAALPSGAGADQEQASRARGASGAVVVGSNEPKGIGVARMAIAMIRSKGNPYQAIELAKTHWKDSPEVAAHIKSVVEAGDTTTSGWASQLVPAAQNMNGDFLDLLRAAVIMGRIPGFKRVPFNVSIPLQSGGGTYGYVGEGAPKPVTSPTYGSATLRFEKAAGIIVITEELARFSSPSAELLVRNEMLEGLTRFFDTVFVSAAAAVTNVSPAGILNGISATAASGTTALKFRYDMNVIIQNMITAKRDMSKLVILMSSGLAMSLSAIQNSLGQSEFPGITATGGNYLGIPIVVSQALGTNIILLDPSDILLAEDPAIAIDVSREASVEMDTAPAGGETSPITTISTLKSFWQNNLVGIRAEQFRTWKVARASAVEYISGAAYTPPAS